MCVAPFLELLFWRSLQILPGLAIPEWREHSDHALGDSVATERVAF
jgi:hypothetical protein